MVGHTHCDVDQLFSIYAKLLRHKSWTGVKELIALILSAYKASPPKIIEGVKKYDWKQWMQPHLASISGHQKSFMFQFSRDETGNIGFLYAGKLV